MYNTIKGYLIKIIIYNYILLLYCNSVLNRDAYTIPIDIYLNNKL